MKVIALILITLAVGHAPSLAARRNSTSTSTTVSPSTTSKTSRVQPLTTSTTTTTTTTTKPPLKSTSKTSDAELIAPGISVSKGFKKGNCLASRFAVLCASSGVDGCVTRDSKTKCGQQCVCGPTDCACGISGCYCQVNAGCSCAK